MNHTPQDGRLLEMIEPPDAVRRIDQSALMRAVDVGRALLKHYLAFVGTIDVLRAEHRLPTCSYAAFRDNEVVPAVALHEFGAFGYRTLINRRALVQQLFAVCRHLMHDNRTCAMLAATQIGLPVLVPERAGVFPFGHALHQVQRSPRAVWIFCRTHEKTLFWRTEIDVVEAVVIADGGSPRAAGIVIVAIPAWFVEATIYLTDIVPVNHIVALQHLHAEEMEIGGHHIVFLAYADDVRVREIGIQHRVPVGPVALIAPALSIVVHKVWADVWGFGFDFDIVEVYMTGVAQVEALRGQVAPHRGLWIGPFLFVGYRVVDGLHVAGSHATFMMDGDV